MSEQIIETTEVSVEQRLAEIAANPVRYARWRDRRLPGFRLQVELPYGCQYAASYYRSRAGSPEYKQLSTSNFYVQKELRGHGIGTRLMKAALVIAKQYGVLQSAAAIENPTSLRIRRSIFGESNMRNTRYPSPERLNVDEAIGFLATQSGLGLDAPEIISVSRLELLDTTGWELPMRVRYEDLQPRVFTDESA